MRSTERTNVKQHTITSERDRDDNDLRVSIDDYYAGRITPPRGRFSTWHISCRKGCDDPAEGREARTESEAMFLLAVHDEAHVIEHEAHVTEGA